MHSAARPGLDAGPGLDAAGPGLDAEPGLDAGLGLGADINIQDHVWMLSLDEDINMQDQV